MSSFAAPACPSPYPPGVQNLTGAELARLAANEKCRQAVRAEVSRRLKDSSNKANYLTFTWFLPSDEGDRAKAFDDLCACCWKATKRRILPFGLFPRTGLETVPNRALSVAKEAQDEIRTVLVDFLYDLKGLSDGEVILRALNDGFRTDVEVANAVRRGVRKNAKYLAYGDDVVRQGEEGECVTLFEITPDDSNSSTNAYNDFVEIVSHEKTRIVEELGEKGLTAWEEILKLVDNLSSAQAETGDAQNMKEFDRSLTSVFEGVYGVRERQARTHKSRFLESIRRIVEAVLENDDLRSCGPKRESDCQMRPACRESYPAGKELEAEAHHLNRIPKISKENQRDRACHTHLSHSEGRLQSGRSGFYKRRSDASL